jgi:hypothetical protein
MFRLSWSHLQVLTLKDFNIKLALLIAYKICYILLINYILYFKVELEYKFI